MQLFRHTELGTESIVIKHLALAGGAFHKAAGGVGFRDDVVDVDVIVACFILRVFFGRNVVFQIRILAAACRV